MITNSTTKIGVVPFLTEGLLNALKSGKERGQIVELTNVKPSTVTRHLGDVRTVLSDAGYIVLHFDPNSPDPQIRSLPEVLSGYLQAVQQRGKVSDEALRLAEILRARTDSKTPQSGKIYRDTLGRLWTVLSNQTPALLFVSNAHSASASQRSDLEHLARFVFADPIDSLLPESDYSDRARGTLVFVEDIEGLELKDATVETVDGSEAAIDLMRELLTGDETVRRFLDAYGSDVEKVRELLEQLPAQAQSLQSFRYRQLDSRGRTVVETLAVASEAVTLTILQETCKHLDAGEYFSRTLRGLTDAGLVTKVVVRGEILVRLADDEFGEAIREEADESRISEIHRRLAESAIQERTPSVSASFITMHLLAAGELQEAVEYGQTACMDLVARNDYDEAQGLLEALQEAGAEFDVPTRQILADVHIRAGEILEAIEVLADLEESLDAEAQGDIALRIADLHLKLGHYDAALAKARSVDGTNQATQHAVALIESEVDYAQGRHDILLERLRCLVEELESDSSPVSTRSDIDQMLIRARNTMGKTLIFRASYGEAEALFRSNRNLAHQWGWDDEVARAQANLGVVALQRTDYAEAADALESALESTGMRGSLPRAYCLVNLATVHQQRNEFDAALDTCLESLRCAKRAGDPVAYSVAAHNLATIYQDLGAFERADNIIEHLESRYEPEAQTLSSRWNRLVVGYLSLDAGRYERAISVFEELAETGSDNLIYGPEAQLRLVQAHLNLGQTRAAVAAFESFDLPEENGDTDKLNLIHDLVEGQLALEDGDFETALKLSRKSGTALASKGGKIDPVTARIVASGALSGLGRDSEAKAELEEAVHLIKALAQRVPEDFKSAFFHKPDHLKVVEALQELDGAVPQEMAPIVEVAPAPVLQARGFDDYDDIVGNDPRLLQIFSMIDRVAPSEATVLIYGESGTGKELISEAIHRQSERKAKPFVKVNCAAFVENLLLSELFGHEKGAFTGAVSQKQGRFELADGGTIFLDEIGDISPNTQVALLRVLQEGTFERVGGSETITTSARVVCATNRNLEEMVERGEFRLDLYYRLKGVVIDTPALRERRQDIPVLARHFARQFGDEHAKQFNDDAMRFLASYSWPGNIRELQNFVRSMTLFVEGPVITMTHIEEFQDFFVSGSFADLVEVDTQKECGCSECRTAEPMLQLVDDDSDRETQLLPAISPGQISAEQAEDSLIRHIVQDGLSLGDLKRRLENEAIRRALIEAGGNVTKAAEMLQMKRPRLSQIVNASEELSDLKTTLSG